MNLLRGGLFLLVLATVVVLSQGSQTATRDSKKKKEKKGQHNAEIAATDVEVEENPLTNQGVELPTGVDVDTEVIPSVEHNGNIGIGRRKQQRKAEKKAQRKAVKKAQKKAERKRHHKEMKRQEKEAHGNKAGRKAAKKAERKAARKLQKQKEAGTEIISFDDIVEERHGDPIPNPLPPVEPGTATESDTIKGGQPPAENTVEERNHKRQIKKERKEKKKQRHHREKLTCQSNSDCGHGCCVEKKGAMFCKPSRKDVGQKCIENCMCRPGLTCIKEEVVPGKEKGFCRVRGTAEVDTDNTIGVLEDAVENVIDNNQ